MPERLMEAVVEKQNMTQAYQRVMSNKGAAGIDQMPVEDRLMEAVVEKQNMTRHPHQGQPYLQRRAQNTGA